MTLKIVDGRTIRRERSRQQIIDALIQLVTDGDREPTAESVAALAGVTTRTVFRHFQDMEALHREIVADLQVQMDATRVAYDPERAWRVQFEELLVRRTGLFETYLPRLRWAESQRSRSPVIEQDLRSYVQRMRKSLKLRLPSAFVADVEAFASLEAILGWEFWLRLRRDQRLSDAKARAVVTRLAHSVLKEAGY